MNEFHIIQFWKYIKDLFVDKHTSVVSRTSYDNLNNFFLNSQLDIQIQDISPYPSLFDKLGITVLNEN